MPEADHPPVAEDEVEARGGDGEDEDTGREVEVERLVEPGREQRRRGEEREGEGAGERAAVPAPAAEPRNRGGEAGRSHQRTRGGNSPCGRK